MNIYHCSHLRFVKEDFGKPRYLKIGLYSIHNRSKKRIVEILFEQLEFSRLFFDPYLFLNAIHFITQRREDAKFVIYFFAS